MMGLTMTSGEPEPEKMRVIPEPDRTRRRVISGADIPYVSENRVGGQTFACGTCGNVLVKNSWTWSIRNIVFECPSCGAFNLQANSSVLAD
jgi:hypothetical protein